jgi:hypothetical protein
MSQASTSLKNLTIILPSLRLFKSLNRSDIFSQILKEYRVSIVLPQTIKEESDNFKYGNLYYYSENKLTQKISKLVLDVETYEQRKINVSFETRIRLLTLIPNSIELSLLANIKYKSKYGFILSLFNAKLVRWFTRRPLRLAGSLSGRLKKVCENTNPDLILCFSGGMYSGVENFVCRFGRKNRLPVFLAIDNWDNLSSKSILWEKPTLLGVWGPEMAIDAMEFHGISQNSIVEIGSSRVDISNTRQNVSEINKKKPYVLFAGSGIQHIDEVEALLKVRVSLNKAGLDNVNVIYRPHPWMLRGNSGGFDRRLNHAAGIEIDSDIVTNGEGSFYNPNSLTHLESLVQNCEFLVAGHSTVIVEALFHGKRVLALNGSTHKLFPSGNSWAIYRHMARIATNPHVFLCENLNNLDDTLKKLQDDSAQPTNFVPELLPNFKFDYQTRLSAGLRKLS